MPRDLFEEKEYEEEKADIFSTGLLILSSSKVSFNINYNCY